MPNQPLPSLIIGLGGSGATTVLRVKEQLVNLYDGVVPDRVGLLVLDTAQKPLAQISRKLDVELTANEVGHLGGNVRGMVERVARRNSETDHIGSWLQADYYLRELPENLFLLEDGAGQLRQFGRLAIFKDVANPNTSEFYQRINDKLGTIQRASTGFGTDDALGVFIVGSLAGGTGAGLFLDAAHLVRKIAGERNMKTIMRGYFFLPEAFGANLNNAQRTQATPRAFAGLRELSRFLLHSDWELGYPMVYLDAQFTANKNVWRGTLDGQLYDLIYLVDGHRARGSLATVPLETGVAPSMADAILGFIDSGAGEYQNAYAVNVANDIRSRKALEGRKPFIGALGTYSIVLPIYQIIEGWSYQLALDSMKTLLMPANYDETTRLPLELSNTDNEESTLTVEDAVQGLLRARDAIIDPRDPQNRIYPTALWPKIYDWHMGRLNNETGLQRQLAGYNADQWMGTLKPAATDQGQTARQAMRLIDSVMNKTAFSEVQTSKEMRSNPQNDDRRIIGAVESLFNGQLGTVTGSGDRQGGVFRDALSDLAQLQIDRFRKAMEAYVLRQLNGQDENRPQMARKGKLGWSLSILNELHSILNSVLTLLRGAASDAQRGNTQRTQTLNNLSSAQQELREITASKPRRAHKAQEAYLDAADRVLDMYRAEIARDTVEVVVRQMRDFVASAIKQLEGWQRILATERESLYGTVYRGQQRTETRKDVAREFPSRKVIQGPVFDQWVNDRYQTYLESSDAVNSALERFQWDAKEETDEGGKPRLRITLKLGDDALRDDMRGEWHQRNSDALMQVCRAVFAPARDRESVLNYLAEFEYKDNPQNLANELYNNSGVLLAYDDSNVGATSPAFYLLAHRNQDNPEDLRFLNSVRQQLGIVLGVGTTDESKARVQDADDPFRLTLVSMVELLPLDKIRSYENSLQTYQRTAPNERPLLHIFPSEVRSVQYEDQLQRRLKQAPRLLSNRVTVLLENIVRFRDFLVLMAHRIVAEDRDYLNEKDNHFVFYLTTPSKDNPQDSNAVDEWWLTKPSSNPSLLEAMTTFIFRETDYGRQEHEPGYHYDIDYVHVDQHLLNVRQYDTNERVSAGWEQNVGIYHPDMNNWLRRLQPDTPEFFALARSVVEYDVLREFAEYIGGDPYQDADGNTVYSRLYLAKQRKEQAVGPANQTSSDQQVDRREQEEAQDMYDLYSIMMLVLFDLIDAKEKDARMAAGLERGGR